MDIFTLKAITQEIRQIVQGAKINRVSQPSHHDLLLSIKTQSDLYNLLISISPQLPRILLTQSPPANLTIPGTFCQYLRKHLIGAVIQSIHQTDMERVVDIKLGKRDALGKIRYYSLIIEIMGKYSNIILVDGPGGLILEAMKRVDTSVSRKREVLPELPYTLPPGQDKFYPDRLTWSEFSELANKSEEEISADWLVKNLAGYYKLLADETIYLWKQTSTPESLESLWQIIQNFVVALTKGEDWESTVYFDCGARKSLVLTPFPLEHLAGRVKRTFKSINDSALFYYAHVIEKAEFREKLARLKGVVSPILQKEERKCQAVLEDIRKAGDAEQYRIKGDLLFANLHRVEKGMMKVTLPNLFSPDLRDIEIELDPRRSPIFNAQKYYKVFVKAKKRLHISKERLELVQVVINYLEQLLYCLDEAKNSEELEAISMELQQQGYLKEEPGEARRRRQKLLPDSHSAPFRRYKVNSHYDIYAGKNNRGNDYLISRVALKDDLWFHARGLPGSHVIVRTLGGKHDIDPQIIETAAQLAAYYSRGRALNKVEVDYTRVKYVKKIKAGKPGLVTYDHHETIRVNPLNAFDQ